MSARWEYKRTDPTPGRVCKDCVAEGRPTNRPAPNPGPRCHTHAVAEKRRRRLAAAGRRVQKTYGITTEQYAELREFQGGRCAICRRATGASKALAVDHDHAQAMRDGHPHDQGCPECVRGLVCSTCNDVLAHLRSDVLAAQRLVAYLTVPPWRRLRQKLASAWLV
jgi:hypothetical protein